MDYAIMSNAFKQLENFCIPEISDTVNFWMIRSKGGNKGSVWR